MSDPALLADLANLVARHADTVRREALALARATSLCAWDGRAARRFRADASPLLNRLRQVAENIDDAARSIRRHVR